MKTKFSASALIDRYFLDEERPYTHRRPVRMKTLLWTLGGALFGIICLLLWLGRDDAPSKAQAPQPDFRTAQNAGSGSYPPSSNSGVSVGGNFSGSSAFGGGGGIRSTQTHSANQVVRRGGSGTDPGAGLPLGSTFVVKLVSSILSTDSTTPVIAEVPQDIYTHGILAIPSATRAIGTAQYDETSRRIQLRFQTLVYPDGDQHTLQAIGMMPDGSAGLEGDYHSGELKRQSGRFLGHFISGLADGMKERRDSGSYGMPYEPGSIKNGLLNGVTLSSEDQAKSFTDDLNASRGSMTLPAGQNFILFLEREYVP